MGRTEGKVALVTGAASGIGRATALLLAREGARIAAADVDADGAERAASEVAAAGGEALALRLDVTVEESWQSAIEQVVGRFGRLDVLVNNAGVGNGGLALRDTSLERWREILAVNLDGVFLGIRHAVPAMAEGGGGSIVNISSIYGVVGARNAGAYCASKGGVTLLTKAAALECAADGSGVRVNSVHPGYIETPMTAPRFADPDFKEAMLRRHPIGRFGRPEDISAAVLWLASDESAFTTGAELIVDGGFTAQ